MSLMAAGSIGLSTTILDDVWGPGGRGVVFLTTRKGTDGFTLPVALKVFSPERYDSEKSYGAAMEEIARVSAQVAQIQQDNLLDVQNFVEQRQIRIMEMEWIDGYDLSRLLAPDLLEKTRKCVSASRWEYLNNVIVTPGPRQSRLKPGVAIAIVRECLAALAALHRVNILHGDVKSSNIMVKRTGNAKIIDIGSAVALETALLHEGRAPPPMPHRRYWKAVNILLGLIWQASAMCSWKC